MSRASSARWLIPAATLPVASWLVWSRPWRRHYPPSPTLDRLLEGAQFRDTIAVRIAASPQEVMQAVKEVTLREMPLARWIGELRYLPGRLIGRAPESDPEQPMSKLIQRGPGNVVLAEEPGREFVVGSVGRLHNLFDQAFVPLADPEAFRTFDAPGYEKLAMSMRVVEADRSGCTLVLEHRTQALNASAQRLFALYWLVIKPMGAFVTYQMFRAVRRRAEAAPSAIRSR